MQKEGAGIELSSTPSTTPRPWSASSSTSNSKTPPSFFTSHVLPVLLFFPKVVFSISFIVLVLAIGAALLPSLLVWNEAVSSGMNDLQQQVLLESITQRAGSVKSQLELKLTSCETAMVGYVAWLNALVTNYAAEETGLDFFVDNVMDCAILLQKNGGCASSVELFAPDGAFLIIQSVPGYGAIFGEQRGYPPFSNVTQTVWLYSLTNFLPIWAFSMSFASDPYEYFNGFSSEWLEELLTPKTLKWTPLSVKENAWVMTTDLVAGVVANGESSFRAIIGNSMAPGDISELFEDSNSDGIICSFIQDFSGCLISSSCEEPLYGNNTKVTRICTWNSSFAEVVASQEYLAQAISDSTLNSSIVLFQTDTLAFGYTLIQTPYGFEAVVTVVAEISYFEQTYISAKNDTQKYVIISIIIAACLAGFLSLVTFLGQFQVIRRIKQISDISMGTEKTERPLVHLNSSAVFPEVDESAGTPNRGFRLSLHSFNIFGHLSEIALILKKLEWLEGKVQIVCAFIPVIAKLVCRKDFSDSKVLESKLSRRLGCYLFIDIEGTCGMLVLSINILDFTPLCEATAPNTSAAVLEVFYNEVEKAAHANEDDLLVKRLGDGLFITWGFKLEVEQAESTRKLPILAYAAALRIAESVLSINEQCKDIVGFQLPDWNLTTRIGISTGPALHGLLKTDCLTSPDVVGAMVNLAARCQCVGKFPAIRELAKRELRSAEDRVLCTITSDMATFDANTVMADPNTKHPPSVSQKIVSLAKDNVSRFDRKLVEGVTLQGIGSTNVAITFVTKNSDNRTSNPPDELIPKPLIL